MELERKAGEMGNRGKEEKGGVKGRKAVGASRTGVGLIENISWTRLAGYWLV